jgi:pSer/pThr/pTyr-binding forkhead associated (FHA) protein
LEIPPLRLVLHPSGAVIECAQPSVLLGRHSTADVRLPQPEVSRRHCRLVYSKGEWQLFDLNSLNGVFVNGLKVQQAVLRHRDELHIGGYTLTVDLLPGDRTLHVRGGEGLDSAGVLGGTPDAAPGAEAGSGAERRMAS